MAKNRIRRRVLINGEMVWVTGDTEQEYAENLMKVMMAKCEPVKVEKPKHEFKAYALNWLNTYSKPNIETATAVTYERQLRLYLFPAFGGKNVEDINSQDIQEMFNSIQGAKETKQKVRMVLNMILEQAVEEELISRNPLQSKNIRIKGRKALDTEPYSVEQMQQLVTNLDKVSEPLDRAYLALQALHPMRLEEVLGLKYGDIDREKGWLYIRRSATHPTRNQAEVKETKTEASKRKIKLVKEIIGYLPEGKPNDFMFGGETPLSYSVLRRMLQRIQRDIGFEESISPRRFRTTVLTDIYDSTKDIKATQAAAGHATATMTLKHYVKGRVHNDESKSNISTLYGLN